MTNEEKEAVRRFVVVADEFRQHTGAVMRSFGRSKQAYAARSAAIAKLDATKREYDSARRALYDLCR